MPLGGDWVDLEPLWKIIFTLSIPLQVLSQEELSEDKMPSGNDWEVVTQKLLKSDANNKKNNRLIQG